MSVIKWTEKKRLTGSLLMCSTARQLPWIRYSRLLFRITIVGAMIIWKIPTVYSNFNIQRLFKSALILPLSHHEKIPYDFPRGLAAECISSYAYIRIKLQLGLHYLTTRSKRLTNYLKKKFRSKVKYLNNCRHAPQWTKLKRD